jgi:ankyrin repeat protein
MDHSSKHKCWLFAWLLLVSSLSVQCISCINDGLPRSSNSGVPHNGNDTLEDYIIKNIKDAGLKKLVEELKKGEKIDLNQRNAYGELPLELALKEIHSKDIIEFLIGKGADIHLTDELGNTLLMNAVTSLSDYNIDVLKILVDKGAKVNAQNKVGKTALILAVEKNHSKQVDFLVKNKADVNQKDQAGNSALHLAIEHLDRVELVKSLLKSPQIDLLARDKDDDLVFHKIARQKRLHMPDTDFQELVTLLVNKIKSNNLSLTIEQLKNKSGLLPWFWLYGTDEQWLMNYLKKEFSKK